MWLEGDVDKDQLMYFTVLVPVLKRFADVRMSVVFLGPGLPSLDSQDTSSVPTTIVDYAQSQGAGNVGMQIFKSAQDQSTCAHVTSSYMLDFVDIADDRCRFYEAFGAMEDWVLMDETLVAPQAGLYKIAVYVEGGTTAKASFSGLDWYVTYGKRSVESIENNAAKFTHPPSHLLYIYVLVLN